MNNCPLISIIITTQNEEKNIKHCLESIKNQTYFFNDKIEIIVVDNNSTDETKELANRYTDLVFNKGPERSAQKNFGMMEIATGKYLMYIDADMILSPTLIEDCVNEMENTWDVQALYIPEIVVGTSPWSKVRRFERCFYDGTVIDGLRVFRESIFIQIGGFDERLFACEDWDVDKKVKNMGKVRMLRCRNVKTWKHSDVVNWTKKFDGFLKEKGVNWQAYGSVIYHNEAEFDLRRYLQKKAYYSKSFDIYIDKWGERDPDIKKQFGLWYRFFVVFIESGKWKKLIKHPLLTFGMYTLRLMVGVNFLKTKNMN